MSSHSSADPIPAIAERDASASTAVIFSDIRTTLKVDVVNLIWRHLATMPGALEWVWNTVRPLYETAGPSHADEIRRDLPLPAVPMFSHDALTSAGLDGDALSKIGSILDSYQHTNALALANLSALLAWSESRTAGTGRRASRPTAPAGKAATKLPPLIPITEMPPAVGRLVEELNGFGEDSDHILVASMYRHLAHWPAYLALVRTMLAPLHLSGQLTSLVADARLRGAEHGLALAGYLSPGRAPDDAAPVLASVRRFVRHPIARMTGICSLILRATPR